MNSISLKGLIRHSFSPDHTPQRRYSFLVIPQSHLKAETLCVTLSVIRFAVGSLRVAKVGGLECPQLYLPFFAYTSMTLLCTPQSED